MSPFFKSCPKCTNNKVVHKVPLPLSIFVPIIYCYSKAEGQTATKAQCQAKISVSVFVCEAMGHLGNPGLYVLAHAAFVNSGSGGSLLLLAGLSPVFRVGGLWVGTRGLSRDN